MITVSLSCRNNVAKLALLPFRKICTRIIKTNSQSAVTAHRSHFLHRLAAPGLLVIKIRPLRPFDFTDLNIVFQKYYRIPAFMNFVWRTRTVPDINIQIVWKQHVIRQWSRSVTCSFMCRRCHFKNPENFFQTALTNSCQRFIRNCQTVYKKFGLKSYGFV